MFGYSHTEILWDWEAKWALEGRRVSAVQHESLGLDYD